MKQLLYIILTLFCIGATTVAQTVVSGTIVDTKREPVPFANIVIKGTTNGTTSDEYGNFNIKIYRSPDTISISAVGYIPRQIILRPYTGQHIMVPLQENVYSLNEVSVEPGENPAHPILRNIIKNKPRNNPDNFPSWKSRVYNKIEVDLKNFGKPKKNKRFWEDMEFIFESLDTLPEDSVPYLPVFITESVSDYYHSSPENVSKEIIHANRLSGVRTKTITQFTGKFYQDFNIYKNFINVDNIGLISPINDQWNIFYKYYLVDSLESGNLKLFKIDFKPRLSHEAAFEGSMWVIDSLYAVYKVDMQISQNANINFLNKLEIRKMYVLQDTTCIPEKEEVLADFNVEGNNKNRTIGIIGRKTSIYQDFVFQEIPKDIMEGPFKTRVNKDALEHTSEYWKKARPERLNYREQGIYDMVDSLNNVPKFKSITDLVETVLFGYKDFGKFEIGPYFYMFSYNPIEGYRLRLGGRTTKDFSEKLRLDGYVAYGFKDNHIKYNLGGFYYFNKQPMRVLSMHFEHDNQLLGKSKNAFMEDNFLSPLISRNPNNKLTLTDQLDVQYEHEWFTGLTTTAEFKWQYIRPGRNVPFYEPDSIQTKALYNKEFGINTHLAIGETYIPGDFQRISLGSKKPIFNFYTGIGSVRLNKTDYTYGRLHMDVFDKLPINPFGYTFYYFQAGVILGSVPFPLLKLHEGNETLTNDLYAFNLMNYYEFASDRYTSLFIEHHFQGFFLNKIPLFRWLKLREVAGFKILYGQLSDSKHRQVLFPEGLTGINGTPYMEASAGIENILRLIRIDSIWRLNYLDHTDNIPKWGIRVSLHIRF